MTRSHVPLLASTLAALAIVCAAPARADELAECLGAHEQAQRLRRDAKLSETRARLEACTREACPEPVRQDCTQWLDELASVQPTLVVVAREAGSGAAVVQARVLVDGAVVADRLTGHALPVDPGERKVRLESPDGRVVEQTLFVSEGEKARRVELTLPPRPPPPTSPAPPSSGPAIAVVVLAAVGVAGVAGFGVLAGVGLARENDLADTCRPHCPQDDIDGVRRLYIAGDVLGLVGVLSGAAAVTIALTRTGSPPTGGTRVRAGPTALAIEGRW